MAVETEVGEELGMEVGRGKEEEGQELSLLEKAVWRRKREWELEVEEKGVEEEVGEEVEHVEVVWAIEGRGVIAKVERAEVGRLVVRPVRKARRVIFYILKLKVRRKAGTNCQDGLVGSQTLLPRHMGHVTRLACLALMGRVTPLARWA